MQTEIQSQATQETLGLNYSRISVCLTTAEQVDAGQLSCSTCFQNGILMRPWRAALIAFAILMCECVCVSECASPSVASVHSWQIRQQVLSGIYSQMANSFFIRI